MFEPAAGASSAVAEQPETAYRDRPRPVVVTGASGFVGTHVCAALAKAGWKIRALVRDPGKGAARLGHLPVEFKVGDVRDAAYVRGAMEGAGAVVHLAAIAIERRGESYDAVNAEATRIVLDAAADARIERFVHMSQNGSDSRSPYEFLRSKGVAQDMVVESALAWTVLRPSVIFGPGDAFVNVLARLVRLSPVVFLLPDGGKARFQPVHADDVARAVRAVLDDDSTAHATYSIGGPAPLTLHQMAERILTAMQVRRKLVPLPLAVARPLIAAAQRLVPNPPVTTSLLDLLTIDNTIPDNALTTTFGVVPTPFAPEELTYLRRITAKGAIASLFRG